MTEREDRKEPDRSTKQGSHPEPIIKGDGGEVVDPTGEMSSSAWGSGASGGSVADRRPPENRKSNDR